ncbi:MAG: STAS domain-containing protein [Acidobacteria bacterium]|nr:STAS domain-containing protein [Acidobacteriota bacterium]MBI3261691.1 STAS domain-containing protein [Acidobacteriota bacterium]
MNSGQVPTQAASDPQGWPRRLAVGGHHFVLAPQEALLEGGPAEELERRVQALFKEGHRHLVVDLRGVERLDSTGIRALVRGHTTAHRLGGSFKLVGPNPHTRTLLQVTRLDTVFSIYDSLDAAEARKWPWRTIAVIVGGTTLCLALVWGGLTRPVPLPTGGQADSALQETGATHLSYPFLGLLKLVVAALIGLLVTAVHRPAPHDKPFSRSMEQAQTLLCVSGAMMMIIIEGSLARAFGIAGAASIIRFRTPVDDPKDVTILFLLMALGMASGLGAFAVAGLGTAFLCLFLILLDRIPYQKPRSMMVDLVADSREFPLTHVQSVFARHGVVFEPRELSQGEKVKATYHAALPPEVSLEDLSADLMAGGTAGLKSIAWEPAKKSAQ